MSDWRVTYSFTLHPPYTNHKTKIKKRNSAVALELNFSQIGLARLPSSEFQVDLVSAGRSQVSWSTRSLTNSFCCGFILAWVPISFHMFHLKPSSGSNVRFSCDALGFFRDSPIEGACCIVRRDSDGKSWWPSLCLHLIWPFESTLSSPKLLWMFDQESQADKSQALSWFDWPFGAHLNPNIELIEYLKLEIGWKNHQVFDSRIFHSIMAFI